MRKSVAMMHFDSFGSNNNFIISFEWVLPASLSLAQNRGSSAPLVSDLFIDGVICRIDMSQCRLILYGYDELVAVVDYV